MQLRTQLHSVDEALADARSARRAGLLAVAAAICLPMSAVVAATATAAVPDTSPPGSSTSVRQPATSDDVAETVVHAAVRRQEPLTPSDDGRKSSIDITVSTLANGEA